MSLNVVRRTWSIEQVSRETCELHPVGMGYHLLNLGTGEIVPPQDDGPVATLQEVESEPDDFPIVPNRIAEALTQFC